MKVFITGAQCKATMKRSFNEPKFVHVWFKRFKVMKTPLKVGLRQIDVLNLLFSRLIVISRNDSKPMSSICDKYFMFQCCLLRYFLIT